METLGPARGVVVIGDDDSPGHDPDPSIDGVFGPLPSG